MFIPGHCFPLKFHHDEAQLLLVPFVAQHKVASVKLKRFQVDFNCNYLLPFSDQLTRSPKLFPIKQRRFPCFSTPSGTTYIRFKMFAVAVFAVLCCSAVSGKLYFLFILRLVTVIYQTIHVYDRMSRGFICLFDVMRLW